MWTETRALWIVPESELENRHSGKTKTLANRLHCWSDHAEIFGQNRQVTELCFDYGKQLGAWSLHPLPILGCLFTSGDLPESLESAKVIDAQHIEHAKSRAETLDPPGVSVGRHPIPAVNRIAP